MICRRCWLLVGEPAADSRRQRGRTARRTNRFEVRARPAEPNPRLRSGRHFRVLRACDCAAVAAGDAVNPVVQPPLEAVDHLLNVREVEPGVKHRDLVRFARSFGVFEVQNVRGDRDDQPVLVRGDAHRESQPFGKCGHRLEDAVAVLVDEAFDLPARFIAGTDTAIRVTAHLANEHPPALQQSRRIDHGACSHSSSEAVELERSFSSFR